MIVFNELMKKNKKALKLYGRYTKFDAVRKELQYTNGYYFVTKQVENTVEKDSITDINNVVVDMKYPNLNRILHNKAELKGIDYNSFLDRQILCLGTNKYPVNRRISFYLVYDMAANSLDIVSEYKIEKYSNREEYKLYSPFLAKEIIQCLNKDKKTGFIRFNYAQYKEYLVLKTGSYSAAFVSMTV